jgi:hypothetical protein
MALVSGSANWGQIIQGVGSVLGEILHKPEPVPVSVPDQNDPFSDALKGSNNTILFAVVAIGAILLLKK